MTLSTVCLFWIKNVVFTETFWILFCTTLFLPNTNRSYFKKILGALEKNIWMKILKGYLCLMWQLQLQAKTEYCMLSIKVYLDTHWFFSVVYVEGKRRYLDFIQETVKTGIRPSIWSIIIVLIIFFTSSHILYKYRLVYDKYDDTYDQFRYV